MVSIVHYLLVLKSLWIIQRLSVVHKSINMKKYSRWAKHHPKSARIIIAVSHVLAVLNAFVLGLFLYFNNWGEARWLLILLANLFFLAYIFYPQKNQQTQSSRSSFYVRQKIHDFTLVVSYSFVLVLGVNNFLTPSTHEYTSAHPAKAQFTANYISADHSKANRKKLRSAAKTQIKQVKKQIRYEFQELKKEYKKQTGDKVGLKVLLIFLTVVVALALGALVAALACDLSCSGQEGLATVVLILGWGGIIWGGIIAVKNILRKIGN